MIAKGRCFIDLNDVLEKVSELDILSHYLGVNSIPCIINSPLRMDNKPSFGLYSSDGVKIKYKDFATKESGGIIDLLEKMWNLSYNEVLNKLWNDLLNNNIISLNESITKSSTDRVKSISTNSNTELLCKVRDWKDYDIEYWESYGISLKWLKYAEVYPISHKIVIKDGKRYVFNADKYAYAYVEHKEGKVTLKIYQPFNKNGYKWSNKHDSSVISLWTKVPEYGDKICICSSIKDALCLWSNLHIPSIAVQGEGYNISNTAINELKRRYKNIYICFDNDITGLKDAEKLSKETGFINIVLPNFNNGKDISDAYKILGKENWLKLIKPLFNN